MEKREGGYGDSIPGPTSGWDGTRRWGDEGRRRWAEVAAAAALQGRGGGARGLGGFVEKRRRAEGPIYSQGMAVERSGCGWRPASGTAGFNGVRPVARVVTRRAGGGVGVEDIVEHVEEGGA